MIFPFLSRFSLDVFGLPIGGRSRDRCIYDSEVELKRKAIPPDCSRCFPIATERTQRVPNGPLCPLCGCWLSSLYPPFPRYAHGNGVTISTGLVETRSPRMFSK